MEQSAGEPNLVENWALVSLSPVYTVNGFRSEHISPQTWTKANFSYNF